MTSRDAALHRLKEFLDRVPRYPQDRNFDRPGHSGVSRLSHWIRYRVITEEECVRAVLARHPFEVAEKFVQEVLWRTYWKGWLELRPRVWLEYADDAEKLLNVWSDHPLYRAACEGRTELPFFNDWVSELCATGYLHNHTRMWFASVWLFTLRLPWQLGAAFMFQHLFDADPASNTLSWRWVGGLHTPGKIYLARPDNIATFSEGRWRPRSFELVHEAAPLVNQSAIEITPLAEVTSTSPPPGSAVLIHDDDLSADLSDELGSEAFRYAVLDYETPHQGGNVHEHLAALRRDTALRAHAPRVSTVNEVLDFVHSTGGDTLHAFFPAVGYHRFIVMMLARELAQQGISVVWHRRAWDGQYQPLARAGFFSFWQRVRRSLEDR